MPPTSAVLRHYISHVKLFLRYRENWHREAWPTWWEMRAYAAMVEGKFDLAEVIIDAAKFETNWRASYMRSQVNKMSKFKGRR